MDDLVPARGGLWRRRGHERHRRGHDDQRRPLDEHDGRHTFTVTGKASMAPEMWLPLLLMVLGFYCFFGAVLLLRMRLEVLRREAA